jgi:hypothetical protein
MSILIRRSIGIIPISLWRGSTGVVRQRCGGWLRSEPCEAHEGASRLLGSSGRGSRGSRGYSVRKKVRFCSEFPDEDTLIQGQEVFIILVR